MVQNKLHYAVHGHTAAEVIYERANAEQLFMGLRNFYGDFPTWKDIGIAKNYLNEEELKILNNSVSGYFDFVEIQAMRHNPMYMETVRWYEQFNAQIASLNLKWIWKNIFGIPADMKKRMAWDRM